MIDWKMFWNKEWPDLIQPDQLKVNGKATIRCLNEWCYQPFRRSTDPTCVRNAQEWPDGPPTSSPRHRQGDLTALCAVKRAQALKLQHHRQLQLFVNQMTIQTFCRRYLLHSRTPSPIVETKGKARRTLCNNPRFDNQLLTNHMLMRSSYLLWGHDVSW